MTPVKHARPHLETHNRADGHSAVRGAAYRLGLKLTDERTGLVHDFRKRKLGEEIVRAVTIAPPGAPSWATDPYHLWNRVEAAERRKDAQIARDYRVPIPFGLTDEQAGDLAEDLARFISDALTVPVSVGLHRDADRDALGQLKPADKQGFHAHLYFPTRALDLSQTDGTAGAAGSTGFGPKLTMLSNKRESSAWVELLNARWAELSNIHLSGADKPAVIDHRSYVRQGVDATPQPKMGVSATAMERNGMTTARGDVLREALMMSEVQRKVRVATAAALAAGPGRAVGNDHRTAAAGLSVNAPVPSARRPSSVLLPVTVEARRVMPRAQRMVRTGAAQRETLAQKVAAAGPKPTNAGEQMALERAVALANIIEGFLQTAGAKMKEHANLLEQARRAQHHAADLASRIEESRRSRDEARQEVRYLANQHPMRIRLVKSGVPGIKDPRQAKRALAAKHDQHVQEDKRAYRTLRVTEAAAWEAVKNARADLDQRKASLMESVVTLANENLPALQQLLGFLPEESAALVREAMEAAGAVLSAEKEVEAVVVLETGSGARPTLRPAGP
jgi:hypothetical protein